MEITDRIKQFIDFKEITNYKFCQIIGVSNGFLTKSRAISSDKIELIIKHFPDINLYWLITGRGEMIRGMEEVGHKKSISNAGNAVNLIDSHKNNIKYNDEVINAKNREIQLLEKQIQLLEKQIQLLEKQIQLLESKRA